jgi:hypothetical protein
VDEPAAVRRVEPLRQTTDQGYRFLARRRIAFGERACQCDAIGRPLDDDVRRAVMLAHFNRAGDRRVADAPGPGDLQAHQAPEAMVLRQPLVQNQDCQRLRPRRMSRRHQLAERSRPE